MLCYGALESSNNPHKEQLWKLVCLRIAKRSLLREFDCEENSNKGLRQWKKVSMSQNRICVFKDRH